MPPPDPARWQRVRDVFAAVADLQASDRPERLTDLCGSDDALRHEVESLLSHDRMPNDPIGDLVGAAAHAAAEAARPVRLGDTLLHYRLTERIGEGGMGIVWRAVDETLGREVAIKVLPPGVGDDPRRLARFEREAKLLASLNHTNIAAIFSLHVDAGVRFLAMEYVPGEELATRLARGRLPLDEVLRVARQIAEALEEAHERGVVHRDLKPANVKLTPSGKVKVLDFGLAKAFSDGPDLHSASSTSNDSVMAQLATREGVVLGTAAYMPPEQARGQPVDKRADIWAFGVVLYEMLTGTRPFAGLAVVDLLAAVVSAEPDWTRLPAGTPPSLERLLRRCLQKDVRQRLRDIGDARIELDALLDARTGPPRAVLETPTAPHALAPAPAAVPPPRTGAWWKAAALLLLVTTAVAGGAWYGQRPLPGAGARFPVFAPTATVFAAGTRSGAAAVIAPDGRTLAFTATDAAGVRLLWVRPINALEARPLAGSEGAVFPFWSPDSQSIGYSVPGRLMKIAIAGGAAQTLCPLSGADIVSRGATWHASGTIVFNNGQAPLFRVPSAGGEATPIGALGPGETSRQFPQFLPDGDHVLYHATGSVRALGGLYVTSVSTGATTRLATADTGAIYDPRTGHLLFGRQGILLAQPFDPATRALSQAPVPIAERLEMAAVPGIVAFSVSETGLLAYGVGDAAGPPFELAWVGRDGRALGAAGPPGSYRGFDLSPDGTTIAAHRHDGDGGDVWIIDTARNATSRFTFDAAQDNSSPAWSPDGDRIAFASFRDGRWGVHVKPANGTGADTRAFELQEAGALSIGPMSWSPDGTSLLFAVFDRTTQWDLWRLWLTGRVHAEPVLQTDTFERHGQISPDGRWLAFMSRETGTNDTYVLGLAPAAGKWAVSSGGGTVPRWRADGRELYYLAGGRMMAVDITARGDALSIGVPVPLFDYAHANVTHPDYYPYAVSRDGQRFLVTRELPRDPRASRDAPVIVVTQWAQALAP